MTQACVGRFGPERGPRAGHGGQSGVGMSLDWASVGENGQSAGRGRQNFGRASREMPQMGRECWRQQTQNEHFRANLLPIYTSGLVTTSLCSAPYRETKKNPSNIFH